MHELSLWQGNQRQIISFLAFNPGASRGHLLFKKLQGTLSTDSFQTILLTWDWETTLHPSSPHCCLQYVPQAKGSNQKSSLLCLCKQWWHRNHSWLWGWCGDHFHVTTFVQRDLVGDWKSGPSFSGVIHFWNMVFPSGEISYLDQPSHCWDQTNRDQKKSFLP